VSQTHKPDLAHSLLTCPVRTYKLSSWPALLASRAGWFASPNPPLLIINRPNRNNHFSFEFVSHRPHSYWKFAIAFLQWLAQRLIIVVCVWGVWGCQVVLSCSRWSNAFILPVTVVIGTVPLRRQTAVNSYLNAMFSVTSAPSHSDTTSWSPPDDTTDVIAVTDSRPNRQPRVKPPTKQCLSLRR